MNIESTKLTTMAVVFSEQLNHSLINRDNINVAIESKEIPQVIETPGLKVFLYSTENLQVILEQTRLLIADTKEYSFENLVNRVIKYFNNLKKTIDVVDFGKTVAYGFNFDFILKSKSDKFDSKELVSDKVASIDNLKNASINFTIDGKDATYYFESRLLEGNEKKYLAHVNVHIGKPLAPDVNLDDLFEKAKREVSNFIEKI